jgi:NAD+ diphosphatase
MEDVYCFGGNPPHFAIDAAGAKVVDVTELIASRVRLRRRPRAARSARRPAACGRVHYLAARPWPFPSSLMMGFLTGALTEEITVNAEELAEARWFSREEIREMMAPAAAGADDPAQVSVPSPIAITHHICRRWCGLDRA